MLATHLNNIPWIVWSAGPSTLDMTIISLWMTAYDTSFNIVVMISLTHKQIIAGICFIALSLAPSVYLYTSKIMTYSSSLNKNTSKIQSLNEDVEKYRLEVEVMKEALVKELKQLNYEMGKIHGELRRIK